uniref:Uncharacterized protein n=1 Tax=Anopheles coluzzii TaxID=1518534 RepID=A0A8W7PRC4_ANOCL
MTTDLVVDFLAKSQTLETLGDRVVIGSESLLGQSTPSPSSARAATRAAGSDGKYRKTPHTGDEPPGGKASGTLRLPSSAVLALKQLLLVLIECSAQSQETIARVGVSCMKHVIFSAGYLFEEEQWVIIASAIHRASTVSMAPLKQLIFAFNRNSNSFYGDCANVKVAARRDSTPEELQRIHSLAQQVFLMDTQRDALGGRSLPVPQEDRSYSFLLYPLQCNGAALSSPVSGAGGSSLSTGMPPSYGLAVDCYIIRIPYRNLIVGMLASQMLLQLIANILLSGLSNVPSELNTCFYSSGAEAGPPGGATPHSVAGGSKTLFYLGQNSKEILLRALRQFLIGAVEFDTRPGLKFLIQKQPLEPPAEQPPAHRSATKGEHPTEGERQKQTIPPEIEQQRALSIQKDVSYKTSALRQLIVASIELIKLLPGEQSEFLQLLLTPRIREAFHFVEEKNPFLSLDAQH